MSTAEFLRYSTTSDYTYDYNIIYATSIYWDFVYKTVAIDKKKYRILYETVGL